MANNSKKIPCKCGRIHVLTLENDGTIKHTVDISKVPKSLTESLFGRSSETEEPEAAPETDAG